MCVRKSFGFQLSEATVCNFKLEVLHQVKDGKNMNEVVIEQKKKGIPHQLELVHP